MSWILALSTSPTARSTGDAVLGVALVAVALGACASRDDDATACPAIASASVRVTVFDVNGAPATDAKVTYAVDGRAAQPAECVNPALDGGCERWVAGWEQLGSFVVSATSADGTKHAEAAAEVVSTGGACPHAAQQAVVLTLR